MNGIFVRGNLVPRMLGWLFPISAITIGIFVFIRPDRDTEKLRVHESVHVRQYIELGFILFPVIYLGSWLWMLIKHRDSKVAYKMIPMEVEARRVAANELGIRSRKWYGWLNNGKCLE